MDMFTEIFAVILLSALGILGILAIVDGIKEAVKYKGEKPTVVVGKSIRHDEGMRFDRASCRVGNKYETHMYTPVYQYELNGIHEVVGPMSSSIPEELGKTLNIYVYKDGTVRFNEISMVNMKVLVGIALAFSSFAMLYSVFC